jgi:hypothetical protein
MNDVKLSRRERRCFVCMATIPSGQGVAHLRLKFLTHAGACCAVVYREARDDDHCTRGRDRPIRELRQRIRALRSQPPSPGRTVEQC